MRPSFLVNRSLLDAAALLRMARHQEEIAPHVDRLSQPLPPPAKEMSEEEDFLRQHAEHLRATRCYLAELFPDASQLAIEDAWARSGALEALISRVAEKEYGYPSSAEDVPPDPKQSCPGFSSDIYRAMYGEAMFQLR
jgi:hypothetical protein